MLRNGKVISQDGIERWYKNDQLHREDGPAVSSNKLEMWFQYGKLHRTDGPAVIRSRPSKLVAWFIEGENISSYQEFQDLTGHSDQYIMYLKLKWEK